MSTIRSAGTKPELALRKALWSKGLRYRVQYSNEKIDIAFPSCKLAIFVDGCFWHGCPIHSHIPKSNQEYWVPKLTRNIERDKLTDQGLKKEGWLVLRFWTHELESSEGLAQAVDKVRVMVQKVI
jgi:DNA mismatch endonuclease, patch repair protein